MKKILLVLVSTLLLFSCGKTEREKIDEEKEKLRIQLKATSELLKEESLKDEQNQMDYELETQILRFINIYTDFKRDSTNMELYVQVLGVTNRFVRMKDKYDWLKPLNEEEYLKLKDILIKQFPEYEKELNK